MKTITIETREQLYLLCKDICFAQRSFYKDSIDIIEQHGAMLKMTILFYCDGKYLKGPNPNKRSVVIICSSIYPATNSMSQAEREYKCQCYYSKIGVIKKAKDSAYLLCLNNCEDKCMTLFFHKYANRLVQKPADIALKHRLSDVVANVLLPKRQGSSFNKTYRGFPIKGIIVIVLLVIVILIRLAIPRGYHPSLK